MGNFEETRDYFILKAGNLGACQPQMVRILTSKSLEDLLRITKDNEGWVRLIGLFKDRPMTDFFTEEQLKDFNII
ncbi:hypothetical protein [uncultured Clostridium sp.]|uniref:hypothetical protein n=1 Tax=uncultured Clostridium sp. TaxID=59620 RepID=UPI0026170AE7|nr:hypothetical protein [uncultured Clostridium sp.]